MCEGHSYWCCQLSVQCVPETTGDRIFMFYVLCHREMKENHRNVTERDIPVCQSRSGATKRN